MHLHGELVPGKEKFDQQRKPGHIPACFAQKPCSEFPRQIREHASGKRTVDYRTDVAGEPCLANRAAHNLARVKRGQVARTPYALMKLRLQK